MGYIAHHAIIVYVSGFVPDRNFNLNEEPQMPDVDAYRETLPLSFQQLLIGPVLTAANGDYVVAFLPDGSKEGWDISGIGDRIRADLIDMFSFQYEDGSSPFDIVEVRFGGEQPEHAFMRQPNLRQGT